MRLIDLQAKFDERPPVEKLLLAVLVLGGLLWAWIAFVYSPVSAETAAAKRQLLLSRAELVDLQLREANAIAASAADPNEPVRQRIARAIDAQGKLDREIQAMAGNLVTPQSMTRMLTSILERQTGLVLVRVENRPPEVVRAATPAANATDTQAQQRIFKHSIVVELTGDYLNLIAYLRRIESFPERFFWDVVSFNQTEWPEASITLELHTLSTEEGFLGV